MTATSNALGLEEVDLEGDPPTSLAEIADLFRLHAAFVARSLRQLGVADRDVEDAVQDVFIVAARKRDTIGVGSERGFLYGTAMRVAMNTRRKTNRLHLSDEPIEDRIDFQPGPTAEELIDRRQARAALDAVLDGMSVEMRAVFTLYTLEQMTTNEIAALLGIPPGTVSSRLKRGREHFDEQIRLLQKRLDRRGGKR